MHHKWAKPFMQPVDPVALHIPDYFDIIKNPMDFGTIQKRLLGGTIQTEAEYLSLVRLVFDNAILYNKATDDVYGYLCNVTGRAIMARTVSEYFEKEYARIQQAGTLLDGDPSTILTRRRSIKRTMYDSYGASTQYRQYALRRSGSIDPLPKKPVVDLPPDLSEGQYAELERILETLQMKMHRMAKKNHSSHDPICV
jgi:CREB-binding protein